LLDSACLSFLGMLPTFTVFRVGVNRVQPRINFALSVISRVLGRLMSTTPEIQSEISPRIKCCSLVYDLKRNSLLHSNERAWFFALWETDEQEARKKLLDVQMKIQKGGMER
jgi:hypothetical protein